MGFFTAAKAIFSSGDMIDKVSKGIDKSIFTKEEQSDAWLMVIKAYEPFKIAQRYIALGLLFILSVTLLLAAGVRIGGSIFCEPVLMTKPGDAIIYYKWWVDDSTWLMNTVVELFAEPFFYAIVFYYAGGAGEGLVNRMMAKKRNILK